MNTNRNRRGGATMEFAFTSLALVPLFLGTGVIGSNMVRSLATIHVARDSGHMRARGLDSGQSGTRAVLVTIGDDIGLSPTAGAGSAFIILSSVTYVDKNACKAGGAVDAGGEPSGCTNYQKWAFTQQLTMGKPSIRTSGRDGGASN